MRSVLFDMYETFEFFFSGTSFSVFHRVLLGYSAPYNQTNCVVKEE